MVLSIRLLDTTATELKAIMAAAAEGFRATPAMGNKAPVGWGLRGVCVCV